jgi:two-component system chemotaxis response regulator CheB
MQGKVRVLIVDDSALVRSLLTQIINAHPALEVVAAAADPYAARELIKQHNPDVLTLDIEMPKMNGIAFLKNLMRLRPMPVVMISTLTQEGAPLTLEAFEYGAVDFLGKPQGRSDLALREYSDLICEKILCAAQANVRALETSHPNPAPEIKRSTPRLLKPNFICAIGASTGGTEAIKEVVRQLPEYSPPLVITQHIPEAFSTSFARRLDNLSAVAVYEAEHNQPVEPGSVYLAPGHSHLRLLHRGGRYICQLDQAPPVNRHRPSVEVLFDSVLAAAGDSAMAVLLTGMGSDGAAALLRLRQAGAVTIAQDEATSVVWGMPGAAVKLGAAQKVLPLEKISHEILQTAYAAAR